MGEIVKSGMAPYEAFVALGLQRFSGDLFDSALLPLLNKYVILQNVFFDGTTTPANQLRLSRGASEPEKLVEVYAEMWHHKKCSRSTPKYILRQVFWEWELHGTPLGGAADKGCNKLRGRYNLYIYIYIWQVKASTATIA